MATSSFDKKIIIKDKKAADVLIEGLSNSADTKRLPKRIDVEGEIERGKELLKRIYCR